jgi:hypothetical protein
MASIAFSTTSGSVVQPPDSVLGNYTKPKRPYAGQVHRLIHQTLNLYDFTATADYIRVTHPGVVLPCELDELVREALVNRLVGCGLSLGND